VRSLIRYDEELLGPKSLLEQGCVLNTLGQRSVVRLTGLMVDGSRLQYTGSAYKDVSVRATLVVRTTAEELKAQGRPPMRPWEMRVATTTSRWRCA